MDNILETDPLLWSTRHGFNFYVELLGDLKKILRHEYELFTPISHLKPDSITAVFVNKDTGLTFLWTFEYKDEPERWMRLRNNPGPVEETFRMDIQILR